MTIAGRFWAKVDRRRGQCWTWLASVVQSGYGHIHSNGRLILAHRVSWELRHGPIPGGMQVLHRCDNRRCVNPDHLFLGTHQDNMDDMVLKDRHCRGERSPAAKLSPADVACARALNRAGASQKALARAFGVSHTTMRFAVLGKNWGSVGAAPGSPRLDKTHCPRGHGYTPGNTLAWGPSGTFRKCRTCRRALKVEQRAAGAAGLSLREWRNAR